MISVDRGAGGATIYCMTRHNLPLAERLRMKSDRSDPDGCWPWTAASCRDGYGYLRFEGRSQLAHRLAYRIANGDFPDELKVCHTCDNPPCVNPSHLFLGTQADNTADMATKRRSTHGERSTSHLSEADVDLIHDLKARGATQRAIAARFGVNPSTVSRIVNGKRWVVKWETDHLRPL